MTSGIGMKLKRLRKSRSVTQLELSKKARVSQGYLSELEAGLERNPGVDVLKRLAKALGVPVTTLLE